MRGAAPALASSPELESVACARASDCSRLDMFSGGAWYTSSRRTSPSLRERQRGISGSRSKCESEPVDVLLNRPMSWSRGSKSLEQAVSSPAYRHIAVFSLWPCRCAVRFPTPLPLDARALRLRRLPSGCRRLGWRVLSWRDSARPRDGSIRCSIPVLSLHRGLCVAVHNHPAFPVPCTRLRRCCDSSRGHLLRVTVGADVVHVEAR